MLYKALTPLVLITSFVKQESFIKKIYIPTNFELKAFGLQRKIQQNLEYVSCDKHYRNKIINIYF